VNPKVAHQVYHKKKALHLEGITLQPIKAVKYLGVWIDKDLQFKEH
jgi:hypothetical protein